MPHGPNVTSMHRIECQRLLLADDAHHLCRALGLVWSPPTWI